MSKHYRPCGKALPRQVGTSHENSNPSSRDFDFRTSYPIIALSFSSSIKVIVALVILEVEVEVGLFAN